MKSNESISKSHMRLFMTRCVDTHKQTRLLSITTTVVVSEMFMLGDAIAGVTPLPIPNREVKPC